MAAPGAPLARENAGPRACALPALRASACGRTYLGVGASASSTLSLGPRPLFSTAPLSASIANAALLALSNLTYATAPQQAADTQQSHRHGVRRSLLRAPACCCGQRLSAPNCCNLAAAHALRCAAATARGFAQSASGSTGARDLCFLPACDAQRLRWPVPGSMGPATAACGRPLRRRQRQQACCR